MAKQRNRRRNRPVGSLPKIGDIINLKEYAYWANSTMPLPVLLVVANYTEWDVVFKIGGTEQTCRIPKYSIMSKYATAWGFVRG